MKKSSLILDPIGKKNNSSMSPKIYRNIRKQKSQQKSKKIH